MAQRNNHARSKKKRKLLRLKNLWTHIKEYRLKKVIEANKPKGKTITGEAVKHAVKIGHGMHKHLFAAGTSPVNQRQRRKLCAQNPHLRNKY